MRKPKLTADEGIHRAFVRAMKVEGKAGAGKLVSWNLDAVPALQAAGAALREHRKFVADCTSVAVALASLVLGALALFQH